MGLVSVPLFSGSAELISSGSFSATAPFIISGIPQNYKDLLLVLNSVSNSNILYVQPNGVGARTNSSYGSSTNINTDTGSVVGNVGASSHNLFYRITNYASTSYKPINFSGTYSNGASPYDGGGTTTTTAAVTSIYITNSSTAAAISGNYLLYGVN